MRGNSGAVNELGTLTYYCRSCGCVIKQGAMPGLCPACGNSLPEGGFGISGDNALSETSKISGFKGRAQITSIDKKVR
jgi:hypothetical protein